MVENRNDLAVTDESLMPTEGDRPGVVAGHDAELTEAALDHLAVNVFGRPVSTVAIDVSVTGDRDRRH